MEGTDLFILQVVEMAAGDLATQGASNSSDILW